jgi:uncharacterized protein YecT (DUF1311 family)
MKNVKLPVLFALAMLTSLAPQSVLAQNTEDDAYEGLCSGGDGSSLAKANCMGEYLDGLKAAQERLVAQIQGVLKGKGPDATDYAAAARYLDEAQKHWEEFAIDDCFVKENTFGSGSIFVLDSLDCKIKHYRWRNDQLEKFREDYIDG